MRRLPRLKHLLHGLCFCLLAASPALFAQLLPEDSTAPPYQFAAASSLESSSAADPWEGGSGGGQVEPAGYSDRYLSKLAIRSGLSTFGTGLSVATNLPYRIDLRAFGNYTNFNWKLNQGGFYIVLNIGMANTGVMADYYPWKSLRISPGVLLYNTNRVSANIQAQPNSSFTINNVDYISDNADPVHGTGALSLGGSGFMATTGWGHIVSRTEKRFHFPFEAGVAFINKPVITFNLQGEICRNQGFMCAPVASYPGFTQNLNEQLFSWNKRVAPFHIYPFIQGGISYTFRYRR